MPQGAAEEDKKIQRKICSVIFKTRREGHGGIPVVFPKIVYLFSKEQHKEPEQQKLFEEALECSAKTMYPRDYWGA